MLGGHTGWDGPLRLFAAVHHLVLTGVAPADALEDEKALDAALAAHAGALARFVREQGVQTNEVGRCIGLLPCFLTATREAGGLPLALVELGPSAGLNLLFDRYRYAYAEGSWGPAGARVQLRAEDEESPVPAALLEQPLEVRDRVGIDLQPVDATTDAGAALLRAFLWPGRDERVDRLEAAVATLREEPVPPRIVRGDYVELLPGLLADRPADVLTVVFQTASTGYLQSDAYAALGRVLDDAGGDGRPLAWVSTRRNEERETGRPLAWEVELRVWPSAERHVAYLDYHGGWLEWRG